MTMTTNELLRVVKKAVERAELIEAYAEALKVENREGVDWAKVNAAIKKKWSRATLIHIKEIAWRYHDQMTVANHQEGL